MKKLKLLFMSIILIGIISVQAQNVSRVSGTVTSETDGMPIPGVSVVIKGTNIGMTTDIDGNYALDIPNNAKTLVFSFVGMEKVEVPITKSVINVQMKSAFKQVDEVIVVGYGTVKREAKTGSISTVSTDDIESIPASSVDKMLAGKLAGVSITSSSGQPGSSSNIRIRGTSSINAGNEPLYVIDGVAVMTGNQGDFVNTSNAIAMLNPNDIESMTILKDAAAASVYGSRAANGVILITTKGGQSGKSQFTARAKFGISSMANDNDYGMMSPAQLLEYRRQAVINAGGNPDDPTGSNYVPYELLSRPQTNWVDHMTRIGNLQQYELNAQGGNARTKFYSSASYHKNEGVFYGIEFNKMQARVNVEHELTKRFKMGAKVNAGYMYGEDVPMQSLYYANPLFAGMVISPWEPAYTEDGQHNINLPSNSNTNPRATAEYNDQWDKQYRFNGNMSFQYKLTDKITLKSINSAEMMFDEGRRYWSPKAEKGGDPTLQTSQSQNRLLSTSNTAAYNNLFNDIHSVRLLLGQEATHSYFWYSYQYSKNIDTKIPYHVEGNETNDLAYDTYTSTLMSWFGILDYNYASKYYLQASLRYDGSSKFGNKDQWGLFYSLGGSWNIHNEDFMSDTEWLQVFKLRASYGVNGNNKINNYQQYGVYAQTLYNGATGLLPYRPANQNLSWEKNKAWNIGLDFTFLTRFSGSIDYYTRETTDMLLDKPLSGTSGFTSAFQNVASMQNSGVEFLIEANIINNTDWRWDVGFNISHNESEILELAGDEMMNYSGDSRLKHIVGENLFTFYLRDYYGVNPTNGEALWRTKDGEITNDFNKGAYINAGSPEPTYTGGFNTSITWRNFNLSTLLEFKGGNKILIIENRYLQSDGNQMSMNQAKSALDYWEKPGDTNVNPKPIAGNQTNSYSFNSDRFIENGDYLRIKDITLSYTLADGFFQRAGINNAKIYASGLNVYTFHDVNFWDPERGVTGMGYGIYPMTKTFVIGINLTF